MTSIRQHLQDKPWLGWAFSIVLLGLAIAFYFRGGSGGKGAYSPDRMKEFVTIRYSDTGDEEKIRRGALEQRLRFGSSGLLDPTKGLINPKTQQPTGFLVDTDGWSETINRINEERKRLGTDTSKAIRSRPDAITVLPPGMPPAEGPAPGATAPETPK